MWGLITTLGPKLLGFVTHKLFFSHVLIAIVGAGVAVAAIYYVFHEGEEAEEGAAATAEVERVESDLKERDKIDAEVRDAGRDGHADDGLQPFYRD